MFDSSKDRNWYIAIYLFILFLSVYFLTASGQVGFTDVGNARIEVLKSLVSKHELTVPAGIGIKGADGREYSLFSIGSVVSAIPFYFLGKLIGVSPWSLINIINQISGAVTVVLVFLFSVSLGYSKRAALYTSIVYGCCTMAWYYSKDSGDHTLETLFVLFSIYFMFQYSINKKNLYFIFSIVSFGFAFITRPTSVLIIPSLLILITNTTHDAEKFELKTAAKVLTRKILLFLVIFSPFLLLTFWYNYYRFGSIFETGYSLMAERLGLDFFSGTQLWTGLSGFLISPGKGFFYYSPVTVLFFFSIKSFIKKNFLPGLSFIVTIIFYLVFMSRYVYWHGDWAWGPRYLFVTMPFFLIPTAVLFDSRTWIEKKYSRRLIILISAFSLFIQIASVSVSPYKHFYSLIFEKNIKFDVVEGEGVQPIGEPPLETYFDWSKSPISAQFKYMVEITKKIENYKYNELPSNAKLYDKVKIAPWFNTFDFWWIYKYFLRNSYSGFIGAISILLLALFSLSRLWMVVK